MSWERIKILVLPAIIKTMSCVLFVLVSFPVFKLMYIIGEIGTRESEKMILFFVRNPLAFLMLMVFEILASIIAYTFYLHLREKEGEKTNKKKENRTHQRQYSQRNREAANKQKSDRRKSEVNKREELHRNHGVANRQQLMTDSEFIEGVN